MTTPRPTRRPESGFTLTELLVTIVVVGLVGTLLSKAMILGLRFTAGTQTRVASTSAAATLNRYFYGDVHSADGVTTGPACGITDVIVRLSRSGTDVVYTYDRPTGALDRVTCTGGDVVTTPLGRFDPAASSLPVTLRCGAETSCPSPMEVTLTVQSDPATPPTALTAVRRSGSS
ncbi:type II secretion system protein [Streptomyces sp. NPDC094447]|uniref:type II secretion system protein n=1 Tax=unclassified Streptomyces TaxID=2593676 RepID=UPI0036C7F748